MRSFRSFLLVATMVIAAAARAQSVHWEKADSSFGNVLQLVFQDCEPDGDPQLPAQMTGKLAFAGRSESVNMVNMSVSRTVTYSYLVQSASGGALRIPAFNVKTNKGVLEVPAFDSTIHTETVASSKLIPESNTVWAGQVFGLTYRLTAGRANNPQINPTFDWNPAPLAIEDWSKPEIGQDVVGGQPQLEVTYHTRAYVKAPNMITLNAATHLLQVQTGAVGFGLFSQARMEPVSVTSDQPVIEVKPLPTAPAGFTGAVGQFKLTSKVVPEQAGIGEPVTWTLELSGTGNWPDIAGLPAREVSKDFQVIQPKAKRTPAEGKVFDVTLTEDVVLVGTKAGTYTMNPVKFVYFDPQSGTYKELTTEVKSVTITPPAGSQFMTPSTAVSTGTPSTPTKSAAPAKPSTITAPASPGGIPRDPLAGSEDATLPMSDQALVGWLCVPAVGLVLFWLALAWRRAVRTDPLRPQREAHARLQALLNTMQSNPSPMQLLAWQHDAAILWRIHHAAPSHSAFAIGPDHHAGRDSAALAESAEWAQLWREADAALYSARPDLPADWVARAAAALAARRVPGFRPVRLLLPQNLLPFAAAIALLLTIVPASLVGEVSSGNSGASPETSYRSGDFAAAEAGWRDTAEHQPTDWVARYNLSLALAQQDRMGEAAAESAAAFVQHPNDPSVHAEFDFTSDKAGFAPGPLVPFLREEPFHSIAMLASPAVWQRVLIVGAFIVALALAVAIWNAYGRRWRPLFWISAVVGVLGAILTIGAAVGHDAYGETANIDAVVVWHAGTLRSVPTEADTTQKTTPLAAGSVAVVNKSFLSWNRLVFSNGQTGWVRHEDIVGLWK